MYSLEYDMLLQILQQFRYTGEVHANLPPQKQIKEGGKVVLFVNEGVVSAGFILKHNGQKIQELSKVRLLLLKPGVLNWELVPISDSKSVGTAPPSKLANDTYTYNPELVSPQTFSPASGQLSFNGNSLKQTSEHLPSDTTSVTQFKPQNIPLPREQIVTWSPLQRTIYLLSDGSRSLEELSTLVSRPSALVQQILLYLQGIGAIKK
jgi:hypothetical protein